VVDAIMSQVSEATQLLADVRSGRSAAPGALMEIVYPELRRLASSYLASQRPDHTLQPTALVHEAFLKLIDRTSPNYNGRAHFFAVAATAMRQILVDHARAEQAAKRGGGWHQVSFAEGLTPAGGSVVDMVALDDALKALSELDARQGRIVEMRFFGGLTVDEAAEVLGVSRTTVEDDWRMARAWLSRRLAGEPAR
jgi:RNA polymerase sigma-70 factor, ECF subfamily